MKKPSTLQLVFGSFVGIVNNRYIKPSIYLPTRVGKYELVSEIQKDKPDKKYGTGVYKKGRKKFFIKTWNGTVRDYDYYSLVNEYLYSRVLSRAANRSDSLTDSLRIRFPNPVAIYQKEHTTSVVYEFIDGVGVDTLTKSKEVKLLSTAIEGLSTLTGSLTKTELDTFSKRNIVFYLFTLPIFTVLALLFNRDKWRVILKSFVICIKNIKISKEQLRLAHGDLHPGNLILTSKNGIQNLYILDCENMVMTYPDYDLSLLTLDPQFKQITKGISEKLKYPASTFLMTYIGIHCAVTDKDIFLTKFLESL